MDNAIEERQNRKRSRPVDGLPSFGEAFAPLAYHLFPDGCPSSVVKDVWPQPPLGNQNPTQKQTRTIISSNEALVAIKNLQSFGKSLGFESSQQDAMVVAACATLVLPTTNNDSFDYDEAVVQRSKLRDGTSLYFRTLLRATLPRPQQPMSKDCLLKLLSTLRQLHSRESRQIKDSDTLMAMICIFQYLTLHVRNGALPGDARQTLSSMYAVLLPLAMTAGLCADAVRLLHAITRRKHVRVDRARRLREFLGRCPTEQQVNVAPLWLLLQLYATYDPEGCGPFFVASSKSISKGKSKKRPQSKGHQLELKGYTRYFSFPDLVWERNFHKTWQRDVSRLVARAGSIRKSGSNDGHGVDNNSNNGDSDDNAPQKYQKPSSSTVLAAMDRLVDSFEGVHSFSSGYGPTKKTAMRASDLLNDGTLSHLMMVSYSYPADGTTEEADGTSATKSDADNLQPVLQDVARLKVCLPFMIQQEWWHRQPASMRNSTIANRDTLFLEDNYDKETSDSEVSTRTDSSHASTSDRSEEIVIGDAGVEYESESNAGINGNIASKMSPVVTLSPLIRMPKKKWDRAASRLRVIEALAFATTQTGSILPEAESMVEDILRSWDGKEDWGAMLCYDILPYVATPNSFLELHAKVLVYLEKLFLFGNSKLQHAIISGAVASLLGNIVAQNTNPDRNDLSGARQQAEMLARRKLVKEIINWANELLLKGFLAQKDGEVELLSSATLDFFRVVCREVSHYMNLVVLPSTSVVYRLLLSKSPVSIDRVCQLLVDYKGCFQRLKQKQDKMGAATGLQIEGLDR